MTKYEEIVKLWQNWNISSYADIDMRLNNFKVLFAYNSGKIENEDITYHDTREVFENGRAVGFTGDPRALFEQKNQKMCYEFLKDKIIKKEPLTIPLVLEIHEILTAGTYDEKRFVEKGERPGSFKKHDYITGRYEVGSIPEKVEDDIQELIKEIMEYSGNNILKAASYFHLRFESIHPFADGNGRVGRTLLNYFLMIKNHPPLIIFEEEKASYYSALESYDKSEDIEPMIIFLRTQVERTWKKTLERKVTNE